MELTKDILKELIKTGNLYWQIPIYLYNGIYKVNSIREANKIVKDRTQDYDYDNHEIFTYWKDKKTPMFDIIINYDENNTGNLYTYEFSDCSLFGMYWFNDNSLSVGQKNMIDTLGLKVPKDIDCLKYTRQNIKIALGNTDFV